MNSDEQVPITTPTIKANAKPLIDSPPKIKIVNNTKNVLNDVLMVLERVLFRALSTTWTAEDFLCRTEYSLILSNTTTVSLIEYPTTVNIAAINEFGKGAPSNNPVNITKDLKNLNLDVPTSTQTSVSNKDKIQIIIDKMDEYYSAREDEFKNNKVRIRLVEK